MSYELANMMEVEGESFTIMLVNAVDKVDQVPVQNRASQLVTVLYKRDVDPCAEGIAPPVDFIKIY